MKPITRLEFQRRLKGMTQEQLAQAIGISQPKISMLEKHGKLSISQATLSSIAKVLEFSGEPKDLLLPVTL